MLHHSNCVAETCLFETQPNLHIKNSFDLFSDEFIFEKKLVQAVQIWHLYFVKYIVMWSVYLWNHILQIDSTSSEHGASYLLGLISISKQMLHFFRWDLFGNWHFAKEFILMYLGKSHFTNWFNFIGACCIIPMVLRKPACSKLNAIFTLFCIYFPQIVWLTLDPKFLLQIWWHDFPSVCINIPDALQDISCYEYIDCTRRCNQNKN